jgi:ABC-type lipoprotein release transport system permease subunit
MIWSDEAVNRVMINTAILSGAFGFLLGVVLGAVAATLWLSS